MSTGIYIFVSFVLLLSIFFWVYLHEYIEFTLIGLDDKFDRINKYLMHIVLCLSFSLLFAIVLFVAFFSNVKISFV